MKTPFIMLYVGAPARGTELHAVQRRYQWLVYRAHDRTEALGMYVTYHPDLVVLDAASDPEFVRAVAPHFMDINVPLLMVYADERQMASWSHPTDAPFRILPLGDDPIEALRGINDLIEAIPAQGTPDDGAPVRSERRTHAQSHECTAVFP